LFSGIDTGQFLDIPSKVALPVYQDNTSTITMAYRVKEAHNPTAISWISSN
jgi:hypothetical protein